MLKVIMFLIFLFILFEIFYRTSLKKGADDTIGIKGKIIAIVRSADGRIKTIQTANIVTNDGDTFYAQKGAGEATTYAFANLVLGSGVGAPGKASTYDSITPIAATEKAPTATYPKTNDLSADNTGKAVDAVTRKYEYTGADFNHAAITEGIVTVAGAAAGAKVLCHFSFGGAFEKTATDTLTVYVNHTMTGA